MKKVIPFYWIMVFFFPLLPPVMGNSQIHINFITLIFSLMFIFVLSKKVSVKAMLSLSVYFLVFQLLLFGSFYNGLKHEQLSMSALFSALRPTLLFLLYFSTAELCRRYQFYKTNEFKVLIVLSFIYVICEVFLLQYSKELVFLLYKREYRPELYFSGTTFFGTTYYSGYSFFCIFLLSFVNLYNNRGLINKFIFMMAFFLVLISLSKTMILALLISSYFMAFLYFRYNFIRFLMLFLPVLVILGLYIFQNEITIALKSADVPALRSINTLLYDSSNSGSLNTRMEQIIESFEIGQSYSVLFGAGLGQDASIESLPAVFLYRYGVIGLLFFYICNFILIVFSLHKLLTENRDFLAINFVLFLWALTLPITQLSGAMVEQSKMALISAIMLGYLLFPNSKSRKLNVRFVNNNPLSQQ